ncbi:hypothetical protein [Tumebacillus permanentifrigoris]|uniref:Pre-peptidase n=1 Tax=Tumebacillus permanentifrigoris TaxID=378543 RepID=A0A316DFK4_9BACL|nr:hypothetical protein [Tumebacillus permanentifrigoris]PWK15999.1 hypothetical protein C7459_102245 [Tumebacillus permanentifrigoris]
MRKFVLGSLFALLFSSTPNYAYAIGGGGNQNIIVPPVTTYPDTYEPNDSSSTAYPISYGQKVTSYLSSGSDVDYYKFVPTTTGMNFLAMSGATNKNYDVIVYDKDLNLIAMSDQPANIMEELSFKVTAGNVYYLQVWSELSDSSSSPYQVKLIASSPVTYAYDSRNRISTATQDRALYTLKYSFIWDKYGNLLKVNKEKIAQ